MSDYAGHTPGPWYIHDFRGMGGSYSISCVTPDHITIADIGRGLDNTDEEALANARLIAAAPALLEALIDTLECYNNIDELSDVVWDNARAAIAKARGG